MRVIVAILLLENCHLRKMLGYFQTIADMWQCWTSDRWLHFILVGSLFMFEWVITLIFVVWICRKTSFDLQTSPQNHVSLIQGDLGFEVGIVNLIIWAALEVRPCISWQEDNAIFIWFIGALTHCQRKGHLPLFIFFPSDL